jgi:hypothetical protein
MLSIGFGGAAVVDVVDGSAGAVADGAVGSGVGSAGVAGVAAAAGAGATAAAFAAAADEELVGVHVTSIGKQTWPKMLFKELPKTLRRMSSTIGLI